jgi:tetratricopeptide (TPR) repeat protein
MKQDEGQGMTPITRFAAAGPMLRTTLRMVLAGVVTLSAAGCDLFKTTRNNGELSGGSDPSLQQQERVAQANAAKQSGDYDTALALFQEILAENPTITTAHLGVGDIYMVKKDYPKAEPHYGLAAKLEPRNFDAQYGHGLALQMLNRFIEAVRAYHRALTIDPESIKANLNLAVTYLQMNEPATAVTFAEKAVSLDPGNGPARINLGAAYEKVGKNLQAIEQYTAAMELVENTPPLMMNLINVLAAEKRYQEAANTAENLVKLEPTANAYERMGWCYFRLSQFAKSIAAYREAVKLDPNHWQSYNGIGVNALNTWLLSKQRDQAAAKEAREAFRKSLRINSDQQKLIALMSNYGL